MSSVQAYNSPVTGRARRLGLLVLLPDLGDVDGVGTLKAFSFNFTGGPDLASAIFGESYAHLETVEPICYKFRRDPGSHTSSWDHDNSGTLVEPNDASYPG